MRFTSLVLATAVLAAPLAVQSATSEAAKFRDRLSMAAAPYLGAAGWSLGGEPVVRGSAADGFVVQVPALAYRAPDHAAGAEFGATILEIRPRDGGFSVVAKPARLKLVDAKGVAADLDFADGVVEGLWLPEREAFRDLKISLRDLRADLGGGRKLLADRIAGSFAGKAGTSPALTASFGGELAVGDLEATAPGGKSSRLDRLSLRLDLTDMQRAPQLALAYRHERPPAAQGLEREFIPVKLSLQGRIDAFPWREALRRLPALVAELGRGEDGAGWRGLGRLLGGAGSQLAVEQLAAATPSLSASGSGQAKFQPDGAAVGQVTVTVKGIDDRLNTIDIAEQRRSPALFPALALIAMLGDSEGRGKAMTRRYRLELLPDGGIGLNGKDLSALTLPTR